MSVFAHYFKWKLGLTGPEVWTTAAERECLERYAAGKERLVEIGVWHGGTSKVLRAAMSPHGTFYAVDPYEPGRFGFSVPRLVGQSELGRVRNGRLVWVRAMGPAAAESEEMRRAGPFDFVFVDAAQTYEALDVEWRVWSPLIAPNGIIALHDTLRAADDRTPEQSSVRYMREVVSADERFRQCESVDTLTVLQRHASPRRPVQRP